MIYDPGAIDAALAAAVGDEPLLIAELRRAFTEGAQAAVDQMTAARAAPDWQAAAWRLKGLAASFGATRLMTLAGTAAEGPAGEATILRQIERAVERL